MSLNDDLNTIKDSIREILDLELSLIRKGVATQRVRAGLHEAVIDLGTHLVSNSPADIIWFLETGTAHGAALKQAAEDGMANLTADQAEEFAKYVAESKNNPF